MVENVECFQTQFDIAGFGPAELLGQHQIGLLDPRAVEVVSALIPEDSNRLRRESVGIEVVIRLGRSAAQFVFTSVVFRGL